MLLNETIFIDAGLGEKKPMPLCRDVTFIGSGRNLIAVSASFIKMNYRSDEISIYVES